mgnify:FL=1
MIVSVVAAQRERERESERKFALSFYFSTFGCFSDFQIFRFSDFQIFIELRELREPS